MLLRLQNATLLALCMPALTCTRVHRFNFQRKPFQTMALACIDQNAPVARTSAWKTELAKVLRGARYDVTDGHRAHSAIKSRATLANAEHLHRALQDILAAPCDIARIAGLLRGEGRGEPVPLLPCHLNPEDRIQNFAGGAAWSAARRLRLTKEMLDSHPVLI
jgi:hypothetical protein